MIFDHVNERVFHALQYQILRFDRDAAYRYVSVDALSPRALVALDGEHTTFVTFDLLACALLIVFL